MLPTKHIQPFTKPNGLASRAETPPPQTGQSRREVLRRFMALAAFAIGGAAFPGTESKAAKKASQKLVKYRGTPKGKRNCSGCTFYLADEKACKVVEGAIDPNGWCLRWSKKRG